MGYRHLPYRDKKAHDADWYSTRTPSHFALAWALLKEVYYLLRYLCRCVADLVGRALGRR